MSTIAENIANVHARILRAAHAVGRDSQGIILMAVSKTRPAAAIREAHAARIQHIGENYLQEALGKMAELQDLPLVWHFIGPIQSNKTRAIAEHFDWVHSVDRLKIAQRLSDQRPDNLPPLNICLQVNISGEDSKSGVPLTELPALAQAVAALPRLCLRGLMAIPAPASTEAERRAPLRALREAMAALPLPLDTLSMGMSDDLDEAIAEGSTMLRIGTALFGARDYSTPVPKDD
ncbi:MAG: YggS family pyridoxal phosphate-dependent enzyme [Pseudomonas sp.]